MRSPSCVSPPGGHFASLSRVCVVNEVAQLLAAAENPKHRVLLMTTYGGGFRVSEVVRLWPEQILSDRMLIRIHSAKGHKDRYTLLSVRMLAD